MLKLNVAEIKKKLVGEKPFCFIVSPQELELSPDDLPLVGEVEIEGKIANGGDVLLLTAQVSGRVRRQCGRCLEQFVAPTQTVVEERYYPSSAEHLPEDALTYQFDVVDITEALRESLLLAEPINVLCKADCKGLCPKCGVNKNLEDCTCDTRTIDPRLSALEALLNKRD